LNLGETHSRCGGDACYRCYCAQNIWHSTLRSKHLKARSLLRAYATALNGRWDDEGARHEAYDTALRQASAEVDSNVPTEDDGTLPARAVKQRELTITLRIGNGADLQDDMALPALTPGQRRTSDSNRSPPAMMARQRAGQGPPVTAPRPVVNDRLVAREGDRGGTAQLPPSPFSWPAQGPPQGMAND
jgi:hypothetical protein